MFIILVNCLTLALYNPCHENAGGKCRSIRCHVLGTVDEAVFIYFVIEMGLWGGQASYLSDSWNRLDLVIIVCGCLDHIHLGNSVGLTAIRIARVLRPLRAVNRIPALRILVSLLLDTLPMLGNVLLLCFLIFFVFGIVGVQLFSGILRTRCSMDSSLVANLTGIGLFNTSSNLSLPSIAHMDRVCTTTTGMFHCSSLQHYKHDGEVCRESIVYHKKEITNNQSFCTNWNQYYKECKGGFENPNSGATSFDNIASAWVTIFVVMSMEGWTDIMYMVQDSYSFTSWIYFVLLILLGSTFLVNLSLIVISAQFSETKRRETEKLRAARAAKVLIVDLTSELLVSFAGTIAERVPKIQLPMIPSEDELPSEELSAGSNRYELIDNMPQEENMTNMESNQSCTQRMLCYFDIIQQNIKKTVNNIHFNRFMVGALLLNTYIMGAEYHDQPELLTTFVESSNTFFAVVIAVEMVLKLLAEGFFNYIQSSFNVFDGTVVIINTIDLLQGEGSGLSILRTFRILRVLKLVRYVPALRHQLLILLQTVGNVTVFFLLLALFIFISGILGMSLFGCKIYGKTEFQDELSGDDDSRRQNFDSLLWALITVFQIIAQEEWNKVLYKCMEKTSHWAAVYFIAVLGFGHYILLNLLIAILVEAFLESSETRQKLEKVVPPAKIHSGSAPEVPNAVEQQTSFSSQKEQKLHASNAPINKYSCNSDSANFWTPLLLMTPSGAELMPHRLDGLEVNIDEESESYETCKESLSFFSCHSDLALRIEVRNMKWYVKAVEVSKAAAIGLERALRINTAKYPLRRVETKTMELHQGVFQSPNTPVFTGQIPRRMVFGCVDRAAFNGAYVQSPFNFKHFLANQVSVTAAGQTFPLEPLQMNYDENKYTRAFIQLFEGLGISDDNKGNGVTLKKFKNGLCLYAFDLSPDEDDGNHWDLIKRGATHINMKFANAIPAGGVELIVYAEFDNLLSIDYDRNVFTDYTP